MGGRHLLAGEPLEQRALLAIVWANQFETNANLLAYGPDEPLARQIIHRAVDDWNRVILDFNYDNDGNPETNNTFELRIGVFPFSNSTRGFSHPSQWHEGTPTRGDVWLDNDGGGSGWFFDATPDDDFEFRGAVTDSFEAALAESTGGGYDFYRAVVHEIGHALGLSTVPESRLVTFLQPAGKSPADSNAVLYTFHNPRGVYGIHGFSATITSSGGGHTYDGPLDEVSPDLPVHPRDLMNVGATVASQQVVRQTISDLDVKILVDAYGYTALLPSQVDTFHVVVDSEHGSVTVQNALNEEPIGLSISRTSEHVRIGVNGTQEAIAANVPAGIQVDGNVVLVSQFAVEIGKGAGPSTATIGSLGVSGSVRIDRSVLAITLRSLPVVGQTFLLVDNDHTDAVRGGFSGVADDGTIHVTDASSGATIRFELDYFGGDGNDVVLAVRDVLQAPPRVARVAASAGFDGPDVRELLQQGKYGTSEQATWFEGDWNGDGIFNQFDLIAAFKQQSRLRLLAAVSEPARTQSAEPSAAPAPVSVTATEDSKAAERSAAVGAAFANHPAFTAILGMEDEYASSR